MKTQLKELFQSLGLIGLLILILVIVGYGASFLSEFSDKRQQQADSIAEQKRIVQAQSEAIREVQTQNKAIGKKQDEIDSRILDLKEQVQNLLP
jgi:uncharacterized protein HemX